MKDRTASKALTVKFAVLGTLGDEVFQYEVLLTTGGKGGFPPGAIPWLNITRTRETMNTGDGFQEPENASLEIQDFWLKVNKDTEGMTAYDHESWNPSSHFIRGV